MKKESMRSIIIWVVILLLVISAFNSKIFNFQENNAKKINYSTFMEAVSQNQVASVTIDQHDITGKKTDGSSFKTYLPSGDPTFLKILTDAKVNVTGKAPEHNTLMNIFVSWFPMLLFVGIWIFFMRQMSGGGKGGAMGFGRSRARLLSEKDVKVTFADVAGIAEAKAEVSELVDFLREPSKFQKLGGKIPRGVLLVGPPGTGKTLLAKAVAGEAKVPFFTISGSDFVEMFVGVGASRVRDMFEQAKKQAPCIIFIDELDAVGRHRGAGLGGGHDEREQTLNQMLVEMDGFEKNVGVIVIAATNRPDVLDPALLRPGRFDRQVVVPLPDINGREQILNVHIKEVPLGTGVDIKAIARGTPGFSGADLANLVNEAALLAASSNKQTVNMNDLELAKDKIIMGAARKTMVMSDKEKELTAYHESGHAIVGFLVPEHDPVHKVTIIPRGRALGVTMFLPEEDRYSHSKQRLESQLSSLYGGRVAEEIIFGTDAVTTGASNDIQRATELARSMITKWGLSEKLGPITFGEEGGEVFLGNAMSKRSQEMSEDTARVIDEEIKSLLDRNYARTRKILSENLEKLHTMAQALIKFETIDKVQIQDIMDGKSLEQLT